MALLIVVLVILTLLIAMSRLHEQHLREGISLKVKNNVLAVKAGALAYALHHGEYLSTRHQLAGLGHGLDLATVCNPCSHLTGEPAVKFRTDNPPTDFHPSAGQVEVITRTTLGERTERKTWLEIRGYDQDANIVVCVMTPVIVLETEAENACG